jgi:hypothetical protein
MACVLRYSEDIRQKMQVYLDNPEYNFDRVNRASQACGPLVKWSIAQVRDENMCTYFVNSLTLDHRRAIFISIFVR